MRCLMHHWSKGIQKLYVLVYGPFYGLFLCGMYKDLFIFSKWLQHEFLNGELSRVSRQENQYPKN